MGFVKRNSVRLSITSGVNGRPSSFRSGEVLHPSSPMSVCRIADGERVSESGFPESLEVSLGLFLCLMLFLSVDLSAHYSCRMARYVKGREGRMF